MSTMKDIARIAGVSTASVSHVINGTKKLSPDTTKRVMDAIEKTNYTPNNLSKSLRSGLTKTIGILVEDIRGLPVPNIVCGISEELGKNGYKTILMDLHLLDELYNRYELIGAYRDRINDGISTLTTSHVDGIIYVGMHDRHLDYLFDPLPIPLVFAYSHGTNQDTYVTYSNEHSATELTRYLVAHGHKKIAVIAGHPHSYPTMRRLSGFQIAMQEAGLPFSPEYVRYGDWEYESGIEKTEELLKLPELPTAIFAMNDLMAAGCIHALNDHGICVPKDIAVVGFDNREISSYLQPPLTTVELPTKEIGVHSAKHLLNMIAHPETSPEKEIIPCKIIERKSV